MHASPDKPIRIRPGLRAGTFRLFGAVLALAYAGAAGAQTIPPPMNFIQSRAYVGVYQNIERDLRDRTEDEALQVRPEARGLADLTFTSSAARTKRNLASITETIRRNDLSQGAEFERIVASGDIIAETGLVMRQYGLDPANLADAYALWWLSSWLAANKRFDTPGVETFAAVRDQSRTAFASDERVAQLGDAEKQEAAEAWIVQSLLVNGSLEDVRNDPAGLASLADRVRSMARADGLDLSAMTLTELGFVPRQGADAEIASPEDGNTALADAESTDDADDGAIFLGLAAVVAAGLGAAYLMRRSAT